MIQLEMTVSVMFLLLAFISAVEPLKNIDATTTVLFIGICAVVVLLLSISLKLTKLNEHFKNQKNSL